MAEAVVTFLLANLTQLLSQNGNLLYGVEDEVKSLHAELQLMNIFVQSDGRRLEDELVKMVVSQIRDVAYEAEDVIDIFVINVLKQRRRNMVRKIFHGIDHLLLLRTVAKKIDSIKKKIKAINDNRDKYKKEVTEIGGEVQPDSLRMPRSHSSRPPPRLVSAISLPKSVSASSLPRSVSASSHKRRRDVEEKDVVGFDNEVNSLKQQLIEGEPQLDVVSIIGMAGLGKTTLARKIYNDSFVKDHFKCRTWVFASQEYYTTGSFLENIIKRVMPVSLTMKSQRNNVDDDQLKEALFTYLTDKRYLIVMDDLWETGLWDEVKSSFPDNLNGSRIMITSRVREVASHASPNPPHMLQFLNKDESWELFSKKVFRGGNTCPPEQEELGKVLALGCGGLPLGIVTLGALFATRENAGLIWPRAVGHVGLYLAQDRQYSDILALSYDNLSSHLKLCFLYICAFPEDFKIPARQLIRLWMAEGFVQAIGNRNMEDIAEEYLEELIDRSLIQVETRRADGGIKTCSIHSLLRDWCILESGRDKFLEVYPSADSSSWSKPRRLSIHGKTSLHLSSKPWDSSSVRSLLCFGQDANRFYGYHWKSICKGFKLVRVLDLGSVMVSNVPNAIEKLVHLRYLRINAPTQKSIPPTICNLWNIETLDMRESTVSCLPKDIWKMQQLRHLYVHPGPTCLPDPVGTDNAALWNLQVLYTVASDNNTKRLMIQDKFPNIKKIGLYSYREEYTKEFLTSLYYLLHLQSLKIMGSCRLPEFQYSFPSSLTKITLVQTYLRSEHMEVLEKVPTLRILKLLQGSLKDREIDCSEGGFPQLNVFQIVNLDIQRWTLRENAMQNLRRLVITKCVGLKMLPPELWLLTTLRDVQVLYPSPVLARNLSKLERNNGCNIRIDSS